MKTSTASSPEEVPASPALHAPSEPAAPPTLSLEALADLLQVSNEKVRALHEAGHLDALTHYGGPLLADLLALALRNAVQTGFLRVLVYMDPSDGPMTRERLDRALRRAGGVRKDAASFLQISGKHLFHHLRRWPDIATRYPTRTSPKCWRPGAAAYRRSQALHHAAQTP